MAMLVSLVLNGHSSEHRVQFSDCESVVVRLVQDLSRTQKVVETLLPVVVRLVQDYE